MSSFVGNLLLTTLICSIVVLLTFAISPLLKKYTKKWRYVIFLVVAIKLLLPMPMYTADNALVIPLVEEANDEKKNSTISNAKTDYAKENGENKSIQHMLHADTDNAKVDDMKNNTAIDNENTDIKANDISDKNVASDAQQSVDKAATDADSAENSIVANSESKANSDVTALQSTENSDVNNNETSKSTLLNIVKTFIADLNLEFTYMVLFSIWCVGVVAFSLYYVFMYFYHRKSINRWSTNVTNEYVLEILKEEKERLNISKNIVLKKCKKINTPMTLGFRHLSIVLPYVEYNEDSTRYILRHELTHQKRNDIYAKVLFIAAKCLHWFNPVVPMMVNRAYDDMEILCDDMVVADMEKEQRIEYNETILNIAKMKSEDVTGKNILFAFCFVEKESNLKERVKNIMVMGKRKKGYQIVALAMSVIVAGSCFISCGTNKKETTEITKEETTEATTFEVTTAVTSNKEVYEQYIRETLAPEYGLADLGKFSTTISMYIDDEGLCRYKAEEKLKFEGIVSAYVDDMNADKIEDMIVVRYEKQLVEESNANYFVMVIEAYTIENGAVRLLDKINAGTKEYTYPNGETHSEAISEVEPEDVQVCVSAITDGTNKYILLDSSHFAYSFADGIYEYHTVFQLEGDKLNAVYSYEQLGAGSSGYELTYLGYVHDEEPKEYTPIPEEGEEYDLGKARNEAIKEFFSNLGINVELAEDGESIAQGDSLVSMIFTYDWNPADTVWDQETEDVSAVFEQTARDYTNVSDLIN